MAQMLLSKEEILAMIEDVPEVERFRPTPLTLEELGNTRLTYRCPICKFDKFNISVYNSIKINGKEVDNRIQCLVCPWRGRKSQLEIWC